MQKEQREALTKPACLPGVAPQTREQVPAQGEAPTKPACLPGVAPQMREQVPAQRLREPPACSRADAPPRRAPRPAVGASLCLRMKAAEAEEEDWKEKTPRQTWKEEGVRVCC